jgi:hypothetical protein
MSRKRRAAVVVFGILLTLTVSVGNVVFAAHATVLDPDFTKDTVEEEEGYAAMTAQFRSQMAPSEGGGGDGSGEGSLIELAGGEAVFADAVTEEHVRAEMNDNVENVYAYLHGNADELNLSLDADPIARNANESAAAAVENSTTAELFEAMGGGVGDLPVESGTLEQLDEGPEAYAEAQAAVRERVYDDVLASAVDRAFEERSNDDLLALVIDDYDSSEYTEAEKEKMVADREPEIRAALASTIERERSDELEEAVDDQLAAAAEDATEEQVDTGDPAVDEPASELRTVTVRALAGDIGYDTYRDRSASARADLGEAIGSTVESEFLAETGGTIDLNEEMGIPEEGLETQVTAVTWLDRLAIILPLLGLVFLGSVWSLTRSVGRTVGTLGWSLAWAGFPTFVALAVLFSDPAGTLGIGPDPGPPGQIMLGLVEGAVGRLSAQSLAVGLLGLGLVGVAFGMRYGLHERLRGAAEPTASREPLETERESDPLADRRDDQTDSTDSADSQHEDR